MKRQRRSFSTEFKHEAACLVLDQGYSTPEAGRSLDIGETALRRWVQQLKLERGGGTPVSKALTTEQKRIQELEARVHRLEREKSILKKATALLMSDEMNRTP
jgi:transposase